MSRITQIDPTEATGRSKALLDAVKEKLGFTPNMMRAMANAPVVLDAYLQFSSVLGKGSLPVRVREQIALTVAQVNGCDYCLAAHSAIGKSVGLTAEQINDSRLGTAIDPKAAALLGFARKVALTRGQVSDADLEDVREVGYDDAIIAEVVAHVALSSFTNFFNNVVRTDVDFPKAAPLTPEPAGV